MTDDRANPTDVCLEADELAHVMQRLSLDELQSLMGISADLAKLNADRFASFGA
ncbi:hypothetical protein OAR11_00055 [Alphaproteobacteria bacterium]|nr:hypothetical protein [Alphaproteobacteria bacterium]